jgi:hypothetical protein
MTRVSKDNVFMAVRDEHQLAAFLNNGWTVVEDKTSTATPKVEEVAKTETTFNHSKTEINRMSTAELHELAKSLNVANEAEMSGANLKEYFIATYNL